MDLFDKEHMCYNVEGRDLALRVESALKDIMDRVRIGKMDIIQAEHIITAAVGVMFCEVRLNTAALPKGKQ